MTSATQLDGTEPVADDELLYRRMPVSQHWYDPSADPKPLLHAFRPRTDDVTGLSVVRGEPYNTAEQSAQGPSKSGYYVGVLRVGDLRTHGLEVVPHPAIGIRGHAEITNLTAANRDSDEAKRIMELLAEQLCLRVEGPLHVACTSWLTSPGVCWRHSRENPSGTGSAAAIGGAKPAVRKRRLAGTDGREIGTAIDHSSAGPAKKADGENKDVKLPGNGRRPRFISLPRRTHPADDRRPRSRGPFSRRKPPP